MLLIHLLMSPDPATPHSAPTEPLLRSHLGQRNRSSRIDRSMQRLSSCTGGPQRRMRSIHLVLLWWHLLRLRPQLHQGVNSLCQWRLIAVSLLPPLDHIPPLLTVLCLRVRPDNQNGRRNWCIHELEAMPLLAPPQILVGETRCLLMKELPPLLNPVDGRRPAPKALRGDAICPMINPSNRDCGRNLGLHNPFL